MTVSTLTHSINLTSIFNNHRAGNEMNDNFRYTFPSLRDLPVNVSRFWSRRDVCYLFSAPEFNRLCCVMSLREVHLRPLETEITLDEFEELTWVLFDEIAGCWCIIIHFYLLNLFLFRSLHPRLLSLSITFCVIIPKLSLTSLKNMISHANLIRRLTGYVVLPLTLNFRWCCVRVLDLKPTQIVNTG